MIAAVLSVLACSEVAASITVTKTNSTGASVNGSSVNQTVSFSGADFPDISTIANATVQIAFSKLGSFGILPANFNEVGFSLTSADGTTVALIRNQNDVATSFNTGSVFSSFTDTITFAQSAAFAVNADPDQIHPGTFRPDDGNLDTLKGGDALGTWTLNISDSDAGVGANSPLTVTSWSITVTSVPEPDSIALWSMTAILTMMIVFHRPRRRNEASPRTEAAGLQPG